MKKTLSFLLAIVLLLGLCAQAAAAEEAFPEERPLDREELDALTEGLDMHDNGFFLSEYDRPEEIDWHEVFYTGAGISVDLTEEQRQAYEAQYGEVWAALTAIPAAAVEEFVLAKTGVSYDLARKPLSLRWTYLPDDGLWVFEHGDTNYQPIEFTGGYASGDEYHLTYRRSDWANYMEDREFVVTAVIRDGEWQFVSNLPADAAPPVTLLDIAFYETLEEAGQAAALTDSFEMEQQPYDEPEGWCWAVLTAREDGVRYIVERVSSVFDYEENAPIVPADYIASGVLDRGESAAVYVNRPWYPSARVTATWGRYWGSYVFGEDNWLYFGDAVPRYVTGHDLDGEGRGCSPASQEELERFLTDGTWVYADPETGEIRATLAFSSPWQMDITTVDEAYPIWLSYDYLYAEEGEAADLVCLEKGQTYYTEWTPLPDWFGDALGDYTISAIQLDGEQLLFLNQANNGAGALGYLLPNAGEDEYSFMFSRYQGADFFEGGGDWYDEAESFEPYLVSVNDPPTPYFSGPGYEYDLAGWIEEEGVFTIVEEQFNEIWWGRLKSGAGWVALNDVDYYGPVE